MSYENILKCTNMSTYFKKCISCHPIPEFLLLIIIKFKLIYKTLLVLFLRPNICYYFLFYILPNNLLRNIFDKAVMVLVIFN